MRPPAADWRLGDRTVVVTGAGGYLGSAMCRAFAAAGARVVGIGRSAAPLQTLADELADSFVPLSGIDVRAEGAVASGLERLGVETIHALVNNAAIGRSGSFRLSTRADFAESLDMHVGAVADVTRQCLPRLEAAAGDSLGSGASIVNVASMYGRVSPDPRLYDTEEGRNPPAYGAAKAAVLQLTRYLACELGPTGIRANSVSPGPFPPSAAPTDLVARLASRVPLGRIGQPAEAAWPVVFLASPLSSFVNGADLPIDGGWTSW